MPSLESERALLYFYIHKEFILLTGAFSTDIVQDIVQTYIEIKAIKKIGNKMLI